MCIRDSNSDAWKVLDKLSRGELPEADQPAEFEDCPTIISIRTKLVEEILRQCGDNLWGECSQYSIEDLSENCKTRDKQNRLLWAVFLFQLINPNALYRCV